MEFFINSVDFAITYSNDATGHRVTMDSCTCLFFSAMWIPCRHIFKFLITNDLEVFAPDLCAKRWSKDYYYKSHPALKQNPQVTAPLPTSFITVRIPSEMEKYKKTAAITRDINNIVSNKSNAEFLHFYEKLKEFRQEAISPNAGSESDNRCDTAMGTITSNTKSFSHRNLRL